MTVPIPVLTPAGIEPAFDLTAYYPALIYAAVVVAFAVGTIAASHAPFIKPSKPTKIKLMPYESGMDPIGSARIQFDVKFYLIAILFLVFDVELLFLYPWAVIAYGDGGGEVWRGVFGTAVFVEILIFLATLAIGYVYSWGKGGVRMAMISNMMPDFMVTKIDFLASWIRKNSLWPMPFATACCGIELMATASARYDIARFGSEAMRFSPRQCDVMIVAGRVVMKMVPVMQRIWQQMSEPKWCISMGACASSGGVFDAYATVQGIDRFLPVDVYVPGCPPRPEQLIRAVLDLQEKIQRTGTIDGREFASRSSYEGPTSLAKEVRDGETIVAPGNGPRATRFGLPLLS